MGNLEGVIGTGSHIQSGREGSLLIKGQALDPPVLKFVAEAGLRADGSSGGIKMKQMAMTTHPPSELAGDPDDKTIIRNVPGDDRPGCDKGIATQGNTTNDCGIGPDGGTAADESPLVEGVPFDLTPGIGDIGQHAGGAEEDVIFDLGACVDGNVILHFDIRSNLNIIGNHGVLSKDATAPNHSTRADVGKVPNFGVFTNDDVVVNNSSGVTEHCFENTKK